MSFQLVIKEGARSDITAAFQYYSSISSALGDDFLERLEQAFERITLGFLATLAVDDWSSFEIDVVLIPINIAPDGSRQIGPHTFLNLPGNQFAPTWSPAAATLAVVNYEFHEPDPPMIELAVLDIGLDVDGNPVINDGEFLADLNTDPDNLTWSPDGSRIGYSDSRTTGRRKTSVTFDVFQIRANGSDGGSPSLVTSTDSSQAREGFPAWNPGWTNDIEAP